MPPSPRLSRARRIGSAVTLLLVVGSSLAGCGSDESDPGSTGETSPSSGASSSTSPSASSDPSESTSSDATVEPASGPVLELGALTLHIPDGWSKGTEMSKLQVTADSPDPRQFFAVSQVRTPLPDQSVMDQAQAVIDGDPFDSKPTSEPIATIGGEPAFHIRGLSAGYREDQLGLVVDKYSYTFHFYSDPKLIKKDADRQAWEETIESMLASVEWS